MTTQGRWIVLIVGFLGWLCAGVHMSITQLVGQSAAIDLLHHTGELSAPDYHQLNKVNQWMGRLEREAEQAQLTHWKGLIARWFAWLQCAFLFGAATGGLVFGWLGDRIGRSKAMAASIITYAALAGAASFAESPLQLCILWFLACTGVGGMWPNGVALVSEAWTGMSRPMVAGVIGVAANIGIFLFATLDREIGHGDWRWAMVVGTWPILLGVIALVTVPESPRWLATRAAAPDDGAVAAGEPPARVVAKESTGIFRPPLLGLTLIAIVLATVPMIGGWGTANWMNPWSEDAGGPALKATVLQTRSITGIVGSLLGGWIASFAGRRWTYFVVSLLSLAFAQYIFVFLTPLHEQYLFFVAALGFVSGIYFGWLPLCLPELFPTRVRSTGAGVGFNFGRIVTAVTIFATGALTQVFRGDYAMIGRCTSMLFILGMVFIWFVPDTGKRDLED